MPSFSGLSPLYNLYFFVVLFYMIVLVLLQLEQLFLTGLPVGFYTLFCLLFHVLWLTFVLYSRTTRYFPFLSHFAYIVILYPGIFQNLWRKWWSSMVCTWEWTSGWDQAPPSLWTGGWPSLWTPGAGTGWICSLSPPRIFSQSCQGSAQFFFYSSLHLLC